MTNYLKRCFFNMLRERLYFFDFLCLRSFKFKSKLFLAYSAFLVVFLFFEVTFYNDIPVFLGFWVLWFFTMIVSFPLTLCVLMLSVYLLFMFLYYWLIIFAFKLISVTFG